MPSGSAVRLLRPQPGEGAAPKGAPTQPQATDGQTDTSDRLLCDPAHHQTAMGGSGTGLWASPCYGHSPQSGERRSEPRKKAAFLYPNQSFAGSEIPPSVSSPRRGEAVYFPSSKTPR